VIENTINKKYNLEFQKYGVNDRRSLFWTKDKQEMRFNLLLGNEFKFSNLTILDYGCGFSDLNTFLVRNFYSLYYSGCDINPNFIEVAQKNYPEHNIYCINSIDDLQQNYDIIAVSGTFNLLVMDDSQQMKVYVFEQIKKLFSHTNILLSVNFLSHLTSEGYRYDGHFYLDPTDLYNFAIQNMTKRITIDTASLPYEITMKFYKNEILDPKLTIYKEFV